ncbi:MAG: hypothetical protein IKC36_02870, partial [Clostridia bacterium]|nr:hypothetical protein [Clostridia bacterium]
ACNKAKEPPHEHTYTKTVTSATCVQEGFTTYTCECGDTYKGTETTPKIPHSGYEKCSVCNFDFFEGLKSIIIENGRPGGSAGVTVYDGKVTIDGNDSMTTYVSYDRGNEEIQVMSIYEMAGGFLGDLVFILTIPHPTNGDALKDCEYAYIFGNDNATAVGVLNARTFSKYTNSLTETASSGFNKNTMSSTRSSIAFLAQYAIKDAFIPLLELSTNGLTKENFGFVNF